VRAPDSLRAGQVEPFLRQAEACIAGLGPGVVLSIDLSALSRFDSSALAALVALVRRARRASIGFVCVGAAPNLRKLAALYDVDRILFGE
jgi:ABC-type transporter Mla MlaB component